VVVLFPSLAAASVVATGAGASAVEGGSVGPAALR